MKKTIKLNQNSYREFRADPPKVPYRYIFIDYFGDYKIRIGKSVQKMYVLCVTCVWSRHINLIICPDLTVKTFLWALQIHVFQMGMASLILSDMGPQIVAGGNIVSDYLKDAESKNYLEENGIQSMEFEQYVKGHNELGSLVESCVKLTKRLISGAIKNNILNFFEFQYIIAQTICIVNKRPVAFHEGLRDTESDEIPAPITPELLLRGYEVPVINIIPELQEIPENDPEWNINPAKEIQDNWSKLRTVGKNLLEIYTDEFLVQLTKQAVNAKIDLNL